MNYAVIGTGEVGRTIATKLVELGHAVTLGSRTPDNEAAVQWAEGAGGGASHGTFADAAASATIVINCVGGGVALQALAAADGDGGGLAGKVLIDLANPLDFSDGFPPKLFTGGGDDSLAERIQRAFPAARVVKALNTVHNAVMVDPSRVTDAGTPCAHTTFVCGDDEGAKATVTALLTEGFGWRDVIDLGGLDNARGTEAWLLLWTRLYRALGTGDFNIRVVR